MKKTIILLIVLLVSVNIEAKDIKLSNADKDFIKGYNLYQEGKFNKSFEIINSSAKKGITEAEILLGLMYSSGNGVERDESKAIKWYRKAAYKGNEKAQFLLGILYYAGKGIKKDDAQAVKWITKSANKDHMDAQLWLASAYRSGRTVPQDYKKAKYLFEKIIEENKSSELLENSNGIALYYLGMMYSKGEGVNINNEKAFRLIKESAEMGYSQAEKGMALIYSNSLLNKKQDYKKSILWLDKSAKKGDLESQIMLGAFYYQGLGVIKDNSIAYSWFSIAAATGDKKAISLRDSFETKLTPEQLLSAQAKAKEYFEKYSK